MRRKESLSPDGLIQLRLVKIKPLPYVFGELLNKNLVRKTSKGFVLTQKGKRAIREIDDYYRRMGIMD